MTGLGATTLAVERIVSGGQTGVDRAALDVALDLGFDCGGWCPKGRRAEDGPIPDRYPLRQAPSTAYIQRTRFNVRDSDATLIVTRGEPTGGTLATLRHAERIARPHLVADLAREADAGTVRRWLVDEGIRVLNVGGPRASQAPGIHAQAVEFLRAVLSDDRAIR